LTAPTTGTKGKGVSEGRQNGTMEKKAALATPCSGKLCGFVSYGTRKEKSKGERNIFEGRNDACKRNRKTFKIQQLKKEIQAGGATRRRAAASSELTEQKVDGGVKAPTGYMNSGNRKETGNRRNGIE